MLLAFTRDASRAHPSLISHTQVFFPTNVTLVTLARSTMPEPDLLVPIRQALLAAVVCISIYQLSQLKDLTVTECELFDQFPTEETMKKYVWCINSTTPYTLKNSVPKTALCCDEDTSEKEANIYYMSLWIPILLAVADFPTDFEYLQVCIRRIQTRNDDKEANKNTPIDAASDAA